MTTTTEFPAGHPAAVFLRLAVQARLLDTKHQAWALVLLTNPVPLHTLDWAAVEVDAQGSRTLAYTLGYGDEMQRESRRLSRTADAILRPGAGPLLELMGAGRATGNAMLKELGLALRDVTGADGVGVTALFGAAVCVARLGVGGTGRAADSADGLVRRAGFCVASTA